MNRRKFFGFLGAGAAASVLPVREDITGTTVRSMKISKPPYKFNTINLPYVPQNGRSNAIIPPEQMAREATELLREYYSGHKWDG